MRIILGCVLMAFMGMALADDKIDAKKVVGKWELKDPPKGMKVAIEFTKDGKFQVTTGKKDDDYGGTYSAEGNMIKVTLKQGTLEIKDVFTVSKLSDTELVFTREDSKKAENFTRIKDK